MDAQMKLTAMTWAANDFSMMHSAVFNILANNNSGLQPEDILCAIDAMPVSHERKLMMAFMAGHMTKPD